MNKPYLLLIVTVFAALFFSCGERRAQKKAAKRGFTWELSGEKGTVLAKDIRSLLKKYPTVFGNTSILKEYADSDTAGFFVQDKEYVWMALYTSEAENAMGYLCAKKQKNGYFLVLSDAGSEFYGNCAREANRYLEKAGPFVIFHQPVNGQMSCASAPEIFRIDGTEINTNDLTFYWSHCDDALLNDPEKCYTENVRFVYKDNRLESVHEREEFTDHDPAILNRRKYKVRYTLQENDLRSRDTTWLP
jgi:hypothetical protein